MKIKSNIFLIAALIGCSANAATSEDALESRFRAVAAMIDAQLTKESVPGAAIGVVHDQELIWSHQYGVESLDTGTPVSNDTLFSICSVSKLFNGIAALNLVEDGRLSLDAPVASYLEGLSTQDGTGAEEPVTVRNILSHISGIPGFSCAEPDGAFYVFPNVSVAMQEVGCTTSQDFSKYLLQEARVATVPGSAFGMEGYIRLSYATSVQLLEQGLARIRKAVVSRPSA